jgi:hypothetical protein
MLSEWVERSPSSGAAMIVGAKNVMIRQTRKPAVASAPNIPP